MMRWYMSSGRTAGTEPEMTSVSPGAISSSLEKSASTSAGRMLGPMPLISVSSRALTFMLMRLMPSATWMKSAVTPWRSRRAAISSPVKPATNPRARFSWPRFLRTMETLMPLPPGSTFSYVTRLTSPSLSSSSLTM